MRILLVHGIGGQDADTAWHAAWEAAVRTALSRIPVEREPAFRFLSYDDLFEQEPLTPAAVLRAMWLLARNGIGSLWRELPEGRVSRGMFDSFTATMRWTAGMVVQWVENDRLREKTRARLAETVEAFRPEVVAAHSLGSLIAYDTLARPDAGGLTQNGALVTLGSQIANPFVAGTFLGGRIRPLPAGKRWFNLHNVHDDVFTDPIHLAHPGFLQVETPFDMPGLGDHDAVQYLGHTNTTSRVWATLAAPSPERAVERTLQASMGRGTRRKALLVGINEYQNPAYKLGGCVNDVYLMSSVLQECGFSPDHIRVVLNDRATTAAIRERVDWLLADAGPRDELVFYFSGHGTVLPRYNIDTVIDRVHECLVPHDFNGEPERAISDEQLYLLYSQLDYQSRFAMILDCCYAGGMSRGGTRVRGIDPPDDIRHRMLRWDADREMWVPRDFRAFNPKLAADPAARECYAGDSGAVVRLGRALPLRVLSQADYNRVRQEQGHRGPYLPMVISACGDTQFAHEYTHGSIDYGAFTFVMCKTLRKRQRVSYERLVDESRRRLMDLDFDQTPTIIGPGDVISKQVPWR